jgi:hypothetical protein
MVLGELRGWSKRSLAATIQRILLRQIYETYASVVAVDCSLDFDTVLGRRTVDTVVCHRSLVVRMEELEEHRSPAEEGNLVAVEDSLVVVVLALCRLVHPSVRSCHCRILVAVEARRSCLFAVEARDTAVAQVVAFVLLVHWDRHIHIHPADTAGCRPADSAHPRHTDLRCPHHHSQHSYLL